MYKHSKMVASQLNLSIYITPVIVRIVIVSLKECMPYHINIMWFHMAIYVCGKKLDYAFMVGDTVVSAHVVSHFASQFIILAAML